MLFFNFISVYCFLSQARSHTIPKSIERVTPEERFETLNLEGGDGAPRNLRPLDPDVLRISGNLTDTDTDTTEVNRDATSPVWSEFYRHFKEPNKKTKRAEPASLPNNVDSSNITLLPDMLNSSAVPKQDDPDIGKQNDDLLLLVSNMPGLDVDAAEKPRNYTSNQSALFGGVEESLSVTAAIEQYLNDLTKKAGLLMWNKPLDNLIKTTVMETLYKFNELDEAVEATTHSLVDREVKEGKCNETTCSEVMKVAKSKLKAIYAKVLEYKCKRKKGPAKEPAKEPAKKECKPCNETCKPCNETSGEQKKCKPIENPSFEIPPGCQPTSEPENKTCPPGCQPTSEPENKTRIQRLAPSVDSEDNTETPNIDEFGLIEGYEKMLETATQQTPVTPINSETSKESEAGDAVSHNKNRNDYKDNLLKIAKKIAYKDYVNGYRYYLDFMKDQRDERQFSNSIKFQAHKRHKVDDIGKFILTKIPRVTTVRIVRKVDNLEKPSESWLKKYFTIYTDEDSTQKYHTKETVLLKSAQIRGGVGPQSTGDDADEKSRTAKEPSNKVTLKNAYLNKVKRMHSKDSLARLKRCYSLDRTKKSEKYKSALIKSKNVKGTAVPNFNADLLDNTKSSRRQGGQVKAKKQRFHKFKNFMFRQKSNKKRDIGVIKKIKHLFNPSEPSRAQGSRAPLKTTIRDKSSAKSSTKDITMSDSTDLIYDNVLLGEQKPSSLFRYLNGDYDGMPQGTTVRYNPLARTSPSSPGIFLGMVRDEDDNSASDIEDLLDASHRMINRANQITYTSKVRLLNNADMNYLAPQRKETMSDENLFFVNKFSPPVQYGHDNYIRNLKSIKPLDKKYFSNYYVRSTTKSINSQKTSTMKPSDNLSLKHKNMVTIDATKTKSSLVPVNVDKIDNDINRPKIKMYPIDSTSEDVGVLSENWHEFLNAYDELNIAMHNQPYVKQLKNMQELRVDSTFNDKQQEAKSKNFKPRVHEMNENTNENHKTKTLEYSLGRIEQDFHDSLQKVKGTARVTTPISTNPQKFTKTHEMYPVVRYTLESIQHDNELNEQNLRAKKIKYVSQSHNFMTSSNAEKKNKPTSHRPLPGPSHRPLSGPHLHVNNSVAPGHVANKSRPASHHQPHPGPVKPQHAKTDHRKTSHLKGHATHAESATVPAQRFKTTAGVATRGEKISKMKKISSHDREDAKRTFWNNFYPSTIRSKILNKIHSFKEKRPSPNTQYHTTTNQQFEPITTANANEIPLVFKDDEMPREKELDKDGTIKLVSKGDLENAEWEPNQWYIKPQELVNGTNSPLESELDHFERMLKLNCVKKDPKAYAVRFNINELAGEVPIRNNKKDQRKQQMMLVKSENMDGRPDSKFAKFGDNPLSDQSIIRKTAIALHATSFVSVYPRLNQDEHRPMPAPNKYNSKFRTTPRPQHSYSTQVLMNATDFDNFLKSNDLDISSVTSPEVVDEAGLKTVPTAVPSRLLDYRPLDVINVGGQRKDRSAYTPQHLPSELFSKLFRVDANSGISDNATSSPMSSIYDSLPDDDDSLGSYDFSMKMVTPSGILDVSFPFKFVAEDDATNEKEKAKKKSKKGMWRRKDKTSRQLAQTENVKTITFLDMELWNSPTHNELIFEPEEEAPQRNMKELHKTRWNRQIAKNEVQSKGLHGTRRTREVDRECNKSFNEINVHPPYRVSSEPLDRQSAAEVDEDDETILALRKSSKKAPRNRTSRRPIVQFLPVTEHRWRVNLFNKAGREKSMEADASTTINPHILKPNEIGKEGPAKKRHAPTVRSDDKCQHDFLSKMLNRPLLGGGKTAPSGNSRCSNCGKSNCACQGHARGGCGGGSGDGSWDWLQSYLGHNRVCSCKCKEDEPMCRPCAASHLVMSELIFELDNMIRYMTDHCTEIQTYFWMNPSGGRKLRSRVHKIDQTINDYFKRVRGKCQGRTCDSFRHCVERKKRRDDRSYSALRSQLKKRKYILRKRYNFYRKAVAAKTAILNEVMFECLNIPLYNEVHKDSSGPSVGTSVGTSIDTNEEPHEDPFKDAFKKRIHHKMFPDSSRALTITNITDSGYRRKRDTTAIENNSPDVYENNGAYRDSINMTNNANQSIKNSEDSDNLITITIKNITEDSIIKKRQISKYNPNANEDVTIMLSIKDGNKEYVLQGGHKKHDKINNCLDITTIVSQLNDLLALLYNVADIPDRKMRVTEMEYIPEKKAFKRKFLDVMKRFTVLYNKGEMRNSKLKTINITNNADTHITPAPKPRYETVKRGNDAMCIVKDLNKISIFSIGPTTLNPENEPTAFRPFKRKSKVPHKQSRNEVFLTMQPRDATTKSTTQPLPTATHSLAPTTEETMKQTPLTEALEKAFYTHTTPSVKVKENKFKESNWNLPVKKNVESVSNAENHRKLLLSILAFDAKKLEADWKQFGGDAESTTRPSSAIEETETIAGLGHTTAYEDDDDDDLEESLPIKFDSNNNIRSTVQMRAENTQKGKEEKDSDKSKKVHATRTEMVNLLSGPINEKTTTESSFWKAFAALYNNGVPNDKSAKIQKIDQLDYVYLNDVITNRNQTMDNSNDTEVDAGIQSDLEGFYATTSVVYTWFTENDDQD